MSRMLERLSKASEARARAAAAPPAPQPARPIVSEPLPAARPSSTWSEYGTWWLAYRRPAMAFSVALVAVVLAGGLLKQPGYEATALLAVNDAAIRNEWDLLHDESRDVDYEEQILSRSVLQPVVHELGLYPPKPRRLLWMPPVEPTDTGRQQQLAGVVSSFRRTLDVERLRHSGIIRITATAQDPAQAAKSANTVAGHFLAYRQGIRAQQLKDRLGAVASEIEAVAEEIDARTRERSEFLAAHQWDDYAAELEQSQRRVNALKDALHRVRSAQGVEGLPEALALTVESGGAGSSDRSMAELAQRLAAADAKLYAALSRYHDGNPIIEQARRERQALRESFSNFLEEHAAQLEAQFAEEQQTLQQLLAQGPQIRQLNLAIGQAEQRYQDLLTQRSDLRLQLRAFESPSGASSQISMLDDALPPPESPWRVHPLLILAALIVGAAGVLLIPVLLHIWHTEFVDAPFGASRRASSRHALQGNGAHSPTPSDAVTSA